VNVVFRVDASHRIGAGHVVRCLTLAAVLGERGARIRFVCRHLPDSFEAHMRSCGYELVRLSATALGVAPDPGGVPHAHWLATTQEEDARQTAQAVHGLDCDWLVVDHYALDQRWERRLRATARAILVIDDLADRRHDCDLLLDQNYYSDLSTRYEHLLTPQAHSLLGPTYALLRPQFAVARASSSSSGSERLFVSMGATDPFRICTKVIESLRGAALANLGADIMTGADEAQYKEIVAAREDLPSVSVHGFVHEIAAIMARCTLAVGAAGSSTWERCAMGLPSIVMVMAAHQRRMAVDLARTGVIMLLGEVAEVSAGALAAAIEDLLCDRVRRSKMRRDALNLVDGQGAYRVAQRIMEMMPCMN
jgi:UDP-2,4-diacetamido-2,4,6-trideoxy-beta-L-altropyranose hydrolase